MAGGFAVVRVDAERVDAAGAVAGRADAAAGVEVALDVVENRVDAAGDCVAVRGDVVV